jgi:hypothetical protein
MIIQLHTLNENQLSNLQVAIDRQCEAGIGQTTPAVDCSAQNLTLGDLLAEITAVNERAKGSGRYLLGKAFAAFFDRCPEVYAVVWAQYAPYFNDGDPCVFGVREPEVLPYFDKVEPEVVALYDGDGDAWDGKPTEDPEDLPWHYGEHCMISAYSVDKNNMTPTQQRVQTVWKELLAPAFTDAAESILQAVFGDDCKVVATRDGFHVGSYEHD